MNLGMGISEVSKDFLSWLNANQGVLTLLIFVATLLLGWISGIFSALIRKPCLRCHLIDGPTFSCTFDTGNKWGDFNTHRTGFALYLFISNVGSAPTSIESVSIGYHWHLQPFSRQWLRYGVGWFWLENQTVALTDFQVEIGNSIKIFPFLFQRNHLSKSKAGTYLRIGESTNGVVYFEQGESWGGCFPRSRNGRTQISLKIRDAHGRRYISRHTIPVVSHHEARKFNPRFGETHAELQGSFLPEAEVQIPKGTGEQTIDVDD